MSVVIGQLEPYYFSVTCWNEACPASLDTYGGPEVIDMACEHAETYGCTLRVEVKSHIEIKPEIHT